jgi:type IV pilus biogenesis protein CpaD/CtpE
MSRPLASALVLVALSALAGCASTAQQAVPHSLASQIPTDRVAAAPPTDFEFELAPSQTAAPRRFTKDAELTGSLHAKSPTRTSNE